MRARLLLLTAVIGAAMLNSCGPSVYREVYPTLVDGRYDSEFPYRGCSAQLEEIGESVKMLSAIAYYRTYTFAPEERLTPGAVTSELLEAHAGRSVMATSQASGTATIISYERRRVGLLTCAHVVGFPDTVLSYQIGPDHRPTGFLRSVSLKEKQTNYVAVFPEGGELEILALDREADIAVLGRTFEVEPMPSPRVLRYPTGRARELEWGTFIYLFGYPTGHKMVTKAIVSSPNKDRRGSFLLDAVFSQGFSGGIALAIRDGVPNFELVGLVKLVPGRTEYLLAPPPGDGSLAYDPLTPYTGEIYVAHHTEIDYGIVQAIPVEEIVDFLDAHRSDFASKGYAFRLGHTTGTSP